MPEGIFEGKPRRRWWIDVLINWVLFLVVCFSIVVIHFWYSTRNIISHGPEKWVYGDLNSLTSALKMYQVNNGHYPSDEQGLLALAEPPAGFPKPRSWTKLMDLVPKDPWGRAYRYRRNDKDFELISDGKDGLPGTKDDISSFKE